VAKFLDINLTEDKHLEVLVFAFWTVGDRTSGKNFVIY
jgi:hypothetical protein